MPRGLTASVCAVVALALFGCAPDQTDDPGALPPGAKVTALDNSFRVENLVVTAGTEVVWDNKGRNTHDILPTDDPSADPAADPAADPSAESWGVVAAEFEPGDSYSFVFTTPGTYDYYCSIHGTASFGMLGSITVTAP